MDQSRRDALKKLGIATGVGAVATTEWAKPVVNALVVPAHAQTTSGSGGGSLNVGLNTDSATVAVVEILSSTDYSGSTVLLVVSGSDVSSSVQSNSFFSGGSASSFTGSVTYFSFAASITVGQAYTVKVDGVSYSVTAV